MGRAVNDGGKGSAPRQKRDDKAYADGWARIFGPKEKPVCFGLDDCSTLELTYCDIRDECGKKEVKDEHQASR